MKFGGGGKVTSLAVSHCGRYLLRGLQSGSILITELAPPSTQSLRAKSQAAESNAAPKLTPLEIAQSGGGSSLFWSHNLVSTAHLGAITSISVNEKGMVALASEDQTISVLHLSALLNQVPQQTALAAQISASLSAKTTADSYTVPTSRLHEHTQGITQLKVTSDGRVYSVSRDHTLKISDAHSQSRIATVSFPSAIACFCLSPTEDALYAGAMDGNIYKVNLWDIASKSSGTNTTMGGVNYNWSSTIGASLAEFDSSENALNDDDGHGATMNTQDTQGEVEPNTYRGHTQAVSTISVSIDGSRLVSSSLDGIVIVWDERTCQVINRITPIKGVPVAWSHIICKPPQTTTSSTSKFKLDAARKEKTSLPFVLVPKPQAVGSASGSIAVPLGTSSRAIPSNKSETPKTFLDLDFTQPIDGSSGSNTASRELEEIATSLADRLKTSHSSEVENLKEEVLRLRTANEKWKQVNNSLFTSTLSSTLK